MRWIMGKPYSEDLRIRIADYLKGFKGQQEEKVVVDQVLVLSPDVLWIVDPRMMYSKQWEEMESYNILEGGATAFSKEGLEDFVVYLCEAYKTRPKLVSLVDNYGSMMSGCQASNAMVIPCAGQEHMRYFSYMHILDVWYSEKPKIRMDRWTHAHWYTSLDLTNPEEQGINLIKDKGGLVWAGPPNDSGNPLGIVRFRHNSKPFIGKVLEFLRSVSGQQPPPPPPPPPPPHSDVVNTKIRG